MSNPSLGVFSQNPFSERVVRVIVHKDTIFPAFAQVLSCFCVVCFGIINSNYSCVAGNSEKSCNFTGVKKVMAGRGNGSCRYFDK